MIQLDSITQTYKGPQGPLEALCPARQDIGMVFQHFNLIAVREQDKDKLWVAKIVKAYQSEEIRKFVQTEFKGAVLAGF
jgi:ABC-type metal ion transport system substrate-binding protein